MQLPLAMINETLKEETIIIDEPKQNEGKYLWEIAKATQVLDLNSPYSYNLIATHFSKTSAIATINSTPVGFVSAYCPPETPNELFIWQIGIDPKHQGKGLGLKLIENIIKREVCKKATKINTTISPSNTASTKLFQKVAKKLNANFSRKTFYTKSDFPIPHEDEDLICIGPLKKTTQEVY